MSKWFQIVETRKDLVLFLDTYNSKCLLYKKPYETSETGEFYDSPVYYFFWRGTCTHIFVQTLKFILPDYGFMVSECDIMSYYIMDH